MYAGRVMVFLGWLGLAISLFYSAVSRAQGLPIYIPGKAADHAPPPLPVKVVESVHQALTNRVIRIAMRLDEFFDDTRVTPEKNTSRAKLSSAEEYAEGGQLKFKQNLSLQLSLPNTEDRFQIFVDNLRGDETIADDEPWRRGILQHRQTSGSSAGVRFIRRDSDLVDTRVAVGANFRSGPNLFVHLIGTRAFDLDAWAPRITGKIFWEVHEGFGAATLFNVDKPFRDDNLFRSSSEIKWLVEESGVQLQQQFNVSRQLTPRKAATLGVGTTAQTAEESMVDLYYGYISYRQLIYRKWLFMEITPELRFPRENDYERVAVLTLKFEMLLEKNK